MPTKKKWVVDEKGFHAVTEFVSAPSKKTAVDLDDEPAQQQKKDEGPEVRLSQPEIVAPSDGFAFDKKCTLKVNVKYLKKTSQKRVMFDLYSEYKGKKELVESGLEGFEKDGVAEAEATLYSPQGYEVGDQAEFFFEASHSKGEKKVESPKVSVPDQNSVIFRLEIDPESEEAQDDKFTLFSTDEGKTYSKTLTVKDDKVPNNEVTDLEFTGLNPSLNYSLEIDPGDEGDPYLLIDNVPFKELSEDG